MEKEHQERYSAGRLVCSIRKGLRLSRQDVCHGLCSANGYVEIERGDGDTNPYLVALLFERMGIAINKYGLACSIEEYDRMGRRCELLACVREKREEERKQLLEEYRELPGHTAKIEEQFLEYVELIADKDSGLSGEELKERALALLHRTVPEFKVEDLEKFRYTGIERALIALVAEGEYQLGNRTDSISLYKRLLLHMENVVQDDEELVREYPAFAMLLTEKLWEMEMYEESHFCNRAVELLRGQQSLNGLVLLLRQQLCAWQKKGNVPAGVEVKTREEGIIALETLLNKSGVKDNFREEIFSSIVEELVQGVLLKNLLRGLRKGQDYTGAELCEGICEPESYSRFERGVTKPRVDIYQALMDRLGREGYRYYPNVVTEDYRLHLLYREIASEIGKLHYEEAEEKLIYLEKHLDMREVINRQSIEMVRVMIDKHKGRINIQEKKERLKKYLMLTVPEGTDLSIYPPNHTEMTLLNGIAIAEAEQGNLEEAIVQLKRLKEVCERNPLFLRGGGKHYFMIVYNLIRCLNLHNKYEEEKVLVKIFGFIG